MREVELFIYEYDGKLLSRGISFEDMLLKEIEYSLDLHKAFPNSQKPYKTLIEAVDTYAFEKEYLFPSSSKQDKLCYMLYETVSLDFDFAKDLRRGDVLKPECFIPKNEIGDAFIYLLSEHAFILTFKKWESQTVLKLDLEVVFEDCLIERLEEKQFI